MNVGIVLCGSKPTTLDTMGGKDSDGSPDGEEEGDVKKLKFKVSRSSHAHL